MPVLTANIAPFIDEVFTITSVWWEEPRNHRGLDITTGQNSPLYSMCNGIVVFSGAQTDGQGNLTGYGYYIIIKDIATKMGFLYAHMREQSFQKVITRTLLFLWEFQMRKEYKQYIMQAVHLHHQHHHFI